MRRVLASVVLVILYAGSVLAEPPSPPSPVIAKYVWLEKYEPKDSIGSRIPLPPGYERIPVDPGSFAQWLRGLPLKEGCPPVLRYDGFPTDDQDSHVAVINMGIGKRDLQQCADSIIRLRAEYLFSTKQFDLIHYKFTSGHMADWGKWSAGERPAVHGSKVLWTKTAARDDSYTNFHSYLEVVFTYAGTRSLSAELQDVPADSNIEIGDLFVQAGSPGHAVIVVDVAISKPTGKRAFLLAQGFMPAQEMHIVKNPKNADLSPWYAADFGDQFRIPAWLFRREHLKRF